MIVIILTIMIVITIKPETEKKQTEEGLGKDDKDKYAPGNEEKSHPKQVTDKGTGADFNKKKIFNSTEKSGYVEKEKSKKKRINIGDLTTSPQLKPEDIENSLKEPKNSKMIKGKDKNEDAKETEGEKDKGKGRPVDKEINEKTKEGKTGEEVDLELARDVNPFWNYIGKLKSKSRETKDKEIEENNEEKEGKTILQPKVGGEIEIQKKENQQIDKQDQDERKKGIMEESSNNTNLSQGLDGILDDATEQFEIARKFKFYRVKHQKQYEMVARYRQPETELEYLVKAYQGEVEMQFHHIIKEGMKFRQLFDQFCYFNTREKVYKRVNFPKKMEAVIIHIIPATEDNWINKQGTECVMVDLNWTEHYYGARDKKIIKANWKTQNEEKEDYRLLWNAYKIFTCGVSAMDQSSRPLNEDGSKAVFLKMSNKTIKEMLDKDYLEEKTTKTLK